MGSAASRCTNGFRQHIGAPLAGLLLIAALLPEQAGADHRHNVLLIVTDDQRPDAVHALGNPTIHTPNLDGLVADGLTFTRAIAPYPICTPSRAEIMTGCNCFRNRVGLRRRKDPQLVLWADCMRDAGYHAWYVGKWMNDGRPVTRGYDESLGLFCGGGGRWPLTHPYDFHGRAVTGYRGWVFQDDEGNLFPEHGVGLTPQTDRRMADAAIEFLRRRPQKPFFLHVNFTAPHDPLLMPPEMAGRYDPEQIPLPPNFLPEHPLDHGNLRGRDELLLPSPRTPEEVRRDLAVYYAVVTHLDKQVGRILDCLENTGQTEQTIVIFTSDHGLAMGSHGLRGKQNMYEHTIGVPLIWRGPGIPSGRKTAAQCYLRDLYPTVCELLGIDIPETVQGHSLVPVIRGQRDDVHAAVFGHYHQFQRMIRKGHWKLIEYPQIARQQLFDLREDPHEMHNLAAEPGQRERVAQLREELRAWQRRVGDPLVAEQAGVEESR
jgi:arylsulfatase A-like enzyme